MIRFPNSASSASINVVVINRRQNNLILYLWQRISCWTPKLNDIIILNFYFCLVFSPIDKLLRAIYFFENSFLFLPVGYVHFIKFRYFLCLHKLCGVGRTCYLDFVSPQVNIRIRKKLKYFNKNLFHNFVCFFKGHIERTSITSWKSTSYLWILWRFSPTRCMTWCINFWYYSDPSNKSISDDLLYLFCCVDLFWTVGGVFCYFWMRV